MEDTTKKPESGSPEEQVQAQTESEVAITDATLEQQKMEYFAR